MMEKKLIDSLMSATVSMLWKLETEKDETQCEMAAATLWVLHDIIQTNKTFIKDIISKDPDKDQTKAFEDIMKDVKRIISMIEPAKEDSEDVKF